MARDGRDLNFGVKASETWAQNVSKMKQHTFILSENARFKVLKMNINLCV